MASDETSDFAGHTSPDGSQTRIGNDKTQFA
jgi:hypothetical protein